MNIKTKTLIGVTAFVVLIAVAVFAYERLLTDENAPDNLVLITEQDEIKSEPEEQYNQNETPRSIAPDFMVLDADNNEVRLSDFFGKPIVLNFWASWCPSCVAEMSAFESMYHEVGNEVHFVKVNLLDGVRETREGVETFMLELDLTFSVYFDTTGEAANAYRVRGIPITFFINAEGEMVAWVQGAADEQTLRNGIEMARE